MKRGAYKFVRVAIPHDVGPGPLPATEWSYELRFFSLDLEHKSQVKEREQPVGAGTIVVLNHGWRFICEESYSLNIRATRDCIQMISQTLDLPQLEERTKG